MKGTVLLIDDNKLDLKIAAQVLELSGYACACFTEYEEALTWLQTETPQLIFLDLQMPKITGYQLIPILRKNTLLDKIPLIIMSGKNQVEDIKKAIQLGANDYIVKPLDTLVLQEKIRKIGTLAKDNNFAAVDVPDLTFPHICFANPLTILSISEFGLRIKATFRVGSGETIELAGCPIEYFGSDRIMIRCLTLEAHVDKVNWIMQFTYIGITEKQRQSIRKICRQLWIQQKGLYESKTFK